MAASPRPRASMTVRPTETAELGAGEGRRIQGALPCGVCTGLGVGANKVPRGVGVSVGSSAVGVDEAPAVVGVSVGTGWADVGVSPGLGSAGALGTSVAGRVAVAGVAEGGRVGRTSAAEVGGGGSAVAMAPRVSVQTDGKVATEDQKRKPSDTIPAITAHPASERPIPWALSQRLAGRPGNSRDAYRSTRPH